MELKNDAKEYKRQLAQCPVCLRICTHAEHRAKLTKLNEEKGELGNLLMRLESRYQQ